MVAVSLTLNRIHYPTPYQFGRIAEYVIVALAIFFISESVSGEVAQYTINTVLFILYLLYVVKREKIDVAALVKSIVRR